MQTSTHTHIYLDGWAGPQATTSFLLWPSYSALDKRSLESYLSGKLLHKRSYRRMSISSKQHFILLAHYKFKATVSHGLALFITVHTCGFILGPDLEGCFLWSQICPKLVSRFSVIMKVHCIFFYNAAFIYSPMRSGHILFLFLTSLYLSGKSTKTIS